MKFTFSHAFGVLLLIASFVFVLQNTIEAKTSFFDFSFSGPFAFVAIILLVGGFLIALSFLWPKIKIQRVRIKQLENEHAILVKKIEGDTIEYRSDGLGTEGEKIL